MNIHFPVNVYSGYIIVGLLGSSSAQVLLNGTLGRRIINWSGLRQGDPLSPMLSIFVMDVLGYMFSKAAEEGLMQPLARWALQHRVSLYVDDVVLFLHPSYGHSNYHGHSIFFWCHVKTKTNLQKSNVLPIRCSDHDLEVI
jgi:hypothetical protein